MSKKTTTMLRRSERCAALPGSVLWLWKGRNPMRHIERGEMKWFLCGRVIGSHYDLDSSEMTFDQMKALVNEPANARYLCEGCAQAIRKASAPNPNADPHSDDYNPLSNWGHMVAELRSEGATA